jgi:hypothetical protein
MEHKQMYPILIKHKIIGYFRYVDDITLIYDQRKANIDETLAKFKKQQPTTNFTVEKDLHNPTFSIFQYTEGKKRSNLQYTDIPLKKCHNTQRLQPSTRA